MTITSLTAALFASYVIDDTGVLHACGRLPFGASGAQRRFIPLAKDVRSMAAGEAFVLLLNHDGACSGAGDNGEGQLGTGDTTSCPQPFPLHIASHDVASSRAVIAGKNFGFHIDAQDRLWGFGCNTFGQLGIGTTENTPCPTHVMDGVQTVAAGSAHTLIVRNDGSLWSCGNNTAYQLGNGSAQHSSTPVRIASDVIAVSAGNQFSVYLDTAGVLWGVGFNGAGQLGSGDGLTVHTPRPLLDNVQHIAAGHGHTLACRHDGSLWVAGLNDFGQLGLGDTTNRGQFTPAPVTSVVQLAAGGYHSLALTADGALWACGSHGSGQLGIGLGVSESTAFQQITV